MPLPFVMKGVIMKNYYESPFGLRLPAPPSGGLPLFTGERSRFVFSVTFSFERINTPPTSGACFLRVLAPFGYLLPSRLAPLSAELLPLKS